MPRMCDFSHFSCTFPSQTKSILHIHFKTILIWVMTHTQTKYQDLLGFDQNPNSISFHLTMNPTTKEGFQNYLVLCGYTNLNFKKSKVRIQFYQNPRFRDKRLTISSLKFHMIHTKSILKVVSIPFWLDLGLNPPSSSSLLSLLLPFSLLYGSSPHK